MPLDRSARQFPLLLAAFAFVGGSVLSPAARAEELPPPEPVEVPTKACARQNEVIAKTRSLLAAKDTAGLEALAGELRTSREQLDGGTWLLSLFYEHAVDVPTEYEPGTRAVAFYEKWARDRPQSITAQVCLVYALARYAWNARGNGYADTVSEARWRHFNERLARARKVLDRAGELPEKCPGLYTAAQRVALGQGWDRVDYRRLVGDAIAFEPTFGQIYTNTCYWLLPRWYGEPGDFEQWIADEANTYPPEERDLQYARFVWMADRMRVSSEMVFAPDRLDWARTKRGFAKWLERMPDNLMVRFEFTALALLANDRKTAAEQFRATGGKYYPARWNEERFEAARRFAFAKGPNPLRPAPAKAAKPPQLKPEVVRQIKLGLGLLSGFVGGLLAGTCLLILAVRRGATGAGVIALLACLAIATPFGTITTVVPALALILYLARRPPKAPPALAPSSGWAVLLWTLLLIAAYLGLQFGAAIVAGIALGVEHGRAAPGFYETAIFRSGVAFTVCTNAAWLSVLILLAICGARNDGIQRRLALFPCAPGRFFVWTAVPLLIVLGANLLNPWMDPRTRAAIESMALGTAAPFSFFLAVAIAAPVAEELIFRGFAFTGWVERIGPWGASLATTLLFAACHFQYGWTGLLFIGVFGVMIAVVRWRTGSVYPCIVIHVVNNLAFGLSLYFAHRA